ncbi:hypothetical protein PGB90_007182 [Kerria lacca]
MSSCDTNSESTGDTYYRIFKELLSSANIQINGNRPFDIRIKNPNIYKRIVQQGSLALGESYMDGWWECDQLDVFFHLALAAKLNQEMPKSYKDILYIIIGRLINFQSRSRSLIVGKEHYNLGNDLFRMMLDPYMQYSCGYWKDAKTLEEAQLAKMKMICDKLQLKPGMKLLDIGCGWGGLAAYAAENYGVSVTGITISTEQVLIGKERCAGLDVIILNQDYRDLNSKYDRIVSVGMFEHVGPTNYSTYFKIVSRNLNPDGLFLLQTIGCNRSEDYVDPWIEKYIFPNGRIPSIRYIGESSEPYLIVENWHSMGPHYDTTLMAWHERFIAAWPTLQHNYSEHFYRMFVFYLNACAGAFRARHLQLWQILFSIKGVEGGLHYLY